MRQFLFSLCLLSGLALSADKPNPQLSLERLYVKREFSAKGYGVKWLEAGQGYARLEKSNGTKDAQDIVQIDPATGKKETLVEAKALIPEGAKKPLAVSGYTFTKDLKKKQKDLKKNQLQDQ